MFQEVITTNPQIAPWFAEAEALESPRGWGLPIMTPKRKIGGDRYALIGDAGGMIEAFTGKGIGPGMMSARIAAEHIRVQITKSSPKLEDYHEHMYKYYRTEMRTAYSLQGVLKYPSILNGAISLANLAAVKRYTKDKMVQDFLRWV
jgi:flavin-dependent dehydrogenase